MRKFDVFRSLFASHSVRSLPSQMTSLENLNFDNLVLRSLPVDQELSNYVRQVSGACFSRVTSTPVKNPTLVAYSQEALALLGLPEVECKRKDLALYFSGNILLPGSDPAAHCYCGHQFGYFSGQLGDGATLYLGEVVNPVGERWELQLKGAGKTPYSRSADGRKVLRSSIREFLCSEAMNSLGIPTTRAGTIVTSDSQVARDIFYTGNNIHERCSIVSRIAPTFIRFGSFEIFKSTDSATGRKGPSQGRNDILLQLTNYVIRTFYQEIWNTYKDHQETCVLEFFRQVCFRTARLVARWQCVGFCHGVLNTDNMSVVGLTIDYGPFGFMDRYDPDFVCNSSDDGGRYSYSRQPEICRWNCMKLAEALQPLLPLAKSKPILDEFDQEFDKEYWKLMFAKFGFLKELPNDRELIKNFLDVMYRTGADFTNCFRALSKCSESNQEEMLAYFLQQCCCAEEYKRAFSPQMDSQQLQLLMMLQAQNPELLVMLGKKADAFTRELELIKKAEELKDMTPAKKSTNDRKLWAGWLQRYINRISDELGDLPSKDVMRSRIALINATNPRIVLRNFIAQKAIDLAEEGDYSEVRRILRTFRDPFDENIDYSDMTAFEEAVKGGGLFNTVEEQKSAEPTCSKQHDRQRIIYDARPPEGSFIQVS